MSAPGTANKNAVQNDLPDSPEGTPEHCEHNVNSVANDCSEDTVLFQYNDGTLVLLPKSKAKALETPKTPAKLKVAESDTSKRLAEPKGNLIPADHPKHGAWSAAVAGKDSEGNDGLIQKAGKFYRNDAAGNMNLVEV